jgi:PAS domain S-box-containing protein
MKISGNIADNKWSKTDNMDFKKIFLNTPNQMVIVTDKGKILQGNNAFCSLLGYTSDELADTDFSSITKEKIKINSISSELLVKSQFVHKNGQTVNAHIRVNQIDQNQYIIHLEHTASDIEPYEKVFLEALMGEIPVKFYFKNRKSEFSLVSQNMLSKSGFTRLEEIIGKTDFDIYSKAHAEEAFIDEQEIMKTGNPKVDYEEMESWPDGSITWVSTSKYPLKNNEGKIIGTFGVSRDITKQKLQEKEIKEKTSILNAITNKMPVAIYKYSVSEGVTSLFGDAEIIEAFYNSKVARLNVADSLSRFAAKVKSNREKQSYYNFPSTFLDKDRGWYFNNYLFESHNNKEGFIGLTLDDSEKKIAEHQLKKNARKLEKINNELNHFAYIVSHDLKAPLRAISNLSEWIEEDLGEIEDEDIKDNLHLLRGRVQRLENLINGILAYSRTSRATIQYEKIDTKRLIEEIIECLGMPKKFIINLPDKMPVITFSKVNMEQIFTNLLSNAVKHHDKPKGQIEIGYRSKPRYHEFTVADDGPGIEEIYHEKVFQMFQTLKARDDMESTGVGLTIVKKIIEDRGGSIRIDSNNVQGAKFIFDIPKI